MKSVDPYAFASLVAEQIIKGLDREAAAANLRLA